MWHSLQLCENILSIFVVTGYIYFSFISYCCHKHWGYFQKCPFLGSHESLRWPITVYLRPSSSVNNFRKLTSWKLQGQLLLLFGTLLSLKPHRQARYAKRTNFKNKSSILLNMWKKLNASYDVHADCLLPKMSNLWPLCNGFRS